MARIDLSEGLVIAQARVKIILCAHRRCHGMHRCIDYLQHVVYQACCDVGWPCLADGIWSRVAQYLDSLPFLISSLGTPAHDRRSAGTGTHCRSSPVPKRRIPVKGLLNTRSLCLAHPPPWQPGSGLGPGEKVCASGRSHIYRPLLVKPPYCVN